MSDNQSIAVDPSRHTWLMATSVAVAAAVSLFVSTPLVAPVLVIGCPVMAAFWTVRDGSRQDVLPWLSVTLVALLLVWFAVTLAWTPDRKPGTWALALFIVSSAAVFLCATRFDHLATDVRRLIAIGFVLGLGFAMWLSLEELATGLYGRRLMNYLWPMTRPHSIQTRGEGNWIVAMMPYVSNKNTAAAMVLTWPWLLISRPFAQRPWQKVLRLATLAALVIAVVLSDHETSKIALLLSAIVYLITRLSRRIAFGLLALGWFAATLAVLPVSLIAYGSGVHLIESVQYSGRHRLVIWGATAERAIDRPIRGHGLASTRVLDEMTAPTERKILPGTTIPEGTNMHSHNVFMQTWHETGLPGALLMFLAGLPVLDWLRTRPDATAAHLFAAYTAAVVLASLSWSLVASWYIATFAFVAIWMLFADAFVRKHADRTSAQASLRVTLTP